MTVAVANWRLDNAKSPVDMLQEKRARTPHTRRIAGVSARYACSHAVRTYIHQAGYLFSFDTLYVPAMYEKESTARHSSNTANTMKMKPKISERKKIPVPSHVVIFCLIGTPCTSQRRKKNKQQSFSPSLVCRRPLSRPPLHRFGPGKAFLRLCHSEPRRPPRVKPGAHRDPRSPARHCWCSDCVRLSANFNLVRQNNHHLDLILQSRTTLILSYVLDLIFQMEGRRSPFMLPSCLEAQTTPSHENGDRAPCKPPSTRQHPLTPATALGSPAVLCSEYTHAQKTKEGRREKELKVQNKFQRASEKKRKRACLTAEETKSAFFFPRDFFLLFPGKTVWHDKQARKETKEREESKDRRSGKKSW